MTHSYKKRNIFFNIFLHIFWSFPLSFFSSIPFILQFFAIINPHTIRRRHHFIKTFLCSYGIILEDLSFQRLHFQTYLKLTSIMLYVLCIGLFYRGILLCLYLFIKTVCLYCDECVFL